MCEITADHADPTVSGIPIKTPRRRRKIWELDTSWHCPIVGTCLSMSDLKRIARKRIGPAHGAMTDYELHVHAVRRMRTGNDMARDVQRRLERNNARVIKRFSRLRGREELLEQWKESLENGDVPGPYWALMTHPDCDAEVEAVAFGDVHMLSHLVGASNRADLARLAALEAENLALTEKLDGERLARRAVETRAREDAEARTRAETAAAAAARRLESETRRADPAARDALIHENEDLRRRLHQREGRIKGLEESRRALESRIQELQRELKSLEEGFQILLSGTEPACGSSCNGNAEDCPLDLAGRCILFVGGSPRQVPRLRGLVERSNGRFLYHDGGLEDGRERLEGALGRADCILFPATQVSHQAVDHIKRSCGQSDKPFFALRAAGVGAFVAGLREAAGQG